MTGSLNFTSNPPPLSDAAGGRTQGSGGVDASALPRPETERDRVALAPAPAGMAIPAEEILRAGAAVWAPAALAQDRDGMARASQSTARDLQKLFNWSPGQVQLAAGYLNKELPRLFSQANFNPSALTDSVKLLPQQLAQHVSASSIRARTSMPPAHHPGSAAARTDPPCATVARTQAAVAPPAPALLPQDRTAAVQALPEMFPTTGVLNALNTLGASTPRTSAVPLDSAAALGAQHAVGYAIGNSLVEGLRPEIQGTFNGLRVSPDQVNALGPRFASERDEFRSPSNVLLGADDPVPRLNVATAPDNNPLQAVPQTYTVQSGDTASGIAKQFYGNANFFTAIMQANGLKYDDLRRLQVGQQLIIPEAERINAEAATPSAAGVYRRDAAVVEAAASADVARESYVMAQRAYAGALARQATAANTMSADTASLFNSIADNKQSALGYWDDVIYNGGAAGAIGGGWARAGVKGGYGFIEGAASLYALATDGGFRRQAMAGISQGVQQVIDTRGGVVVDAATAYYNSRSGGQIAEDMGGAVFGTLASLGAGRALSVAGDAGLAAASRGAQATARLLGPKLADVTEAYLARTGGLSYVVPPVERALEWTYNIPETSPFITRVDPAFPGRPDPRFTVDTTGFRPGTPNNAAGFPRSYEQFWTTWASQVPESLSPGNLRLAQQGLSPTIDDTWIRTFPEHALYKGDLMHHHHVSLGRYAMPVPASTHTSSSGIWHLQGFKNSP